MALEINLKILGQSKSGRSIVIQDATGLEEFGRSTGYGTTNGSPEQILRYYITVSRMFDSLTYQMVLDGSDEFLPTPVQMAWGYKLELTTGLFAHETERGSTEPSEIFKDGLLDVNLYPVFAGRSGVTIEKGTNFIYGGDDVFFPEELKADSVVVNDVIYPIDKSMYDNGGSIIYIVGSFEEDATSFDVAYRGNVKAMLTSMSENLHGYACALLRDQLDHPDWQKINTAQSFRRAAQGFFADIEKPDYAKADDLVQGSFKLLRKFAI